MTPRLRRFGAQIMDYLVGGLVVACLGLVGAMLFGGRAHAQAASAPAPEPPCLPNNSTIKGTGTDAKMFETAEVVGNVGWCPTNSGGWRIFIHTWCLRSVCDNDPPTTGSAVMAALARVIAASSPAAQVKTEWASVRRPLQTELERWHLRSWRHQACQWLTSTQPGVTPRPAMPIELGVKNSDGTPYVPPMNYCDPWAPGAKPVPPVSGWKAAGGAIYKHDGTRLTGVVSGKTAAKDAPCTGVTVAKAGTFVYQELTGGVAGEATRCMPP